MVNTKTMGHVFRHPNYYKQLKEKYEKEKPIDRDDDPQASSAVETGDRVPDPEQQASSSKHQAPSSKPKR
jgi:hypothetical protein